MNLELDVQRAAGAVADPGDAQLIMWLQRVLAEPTVNWRREEGDGIMATLRCGAQLTIRMVDRAESAELNQRYRHKEGPTNILSFPFDQPLLMAPPLLGDLVICVPLLEDEAQQQHKTIAAHWAHLVIHGLLHLLGYDHENKVEAEEMEGLEVLVLSQLGYADPYDADQAVSPL